MSKNKTFKNLLSINNSRFILNINLANSWTWCVQEVKNFEKIILPFAITCSKVSDQPVFRLLFFKLMIEMAIKHHE